MTIDLNKMRELGHIIRLQNREYTTHAGLLATAHENGLVGVDVVVLSDDPEARRGVCSATATGERGTFTDVGDADPSNVNKNIATAYLRMASTRASSRALRLYLGVGMTCYEELPGNDNDKPEPAGKNGKDQSWEEVGPGWCARLKNYGLDYKVVKYMTQVWGKPSPANMTPDERAKLMNYITGLTETNVKEWLRRYKGDVEGAPQPGEDEHGEVTEVVGEAPSTDLPEEYTDDLF